jgi:peptidoglycan glycosyltransferase
VAAAVLAALVAALAVPAHLATVEGRERLLAGDAAAAERAFARAAGWRPDAPRAEAGRALARALRGDPPGRVNRPSELLAFEPMALVDAALDRGDLGAAAVLADLAARAGHPLGDLYAAAIAFERGDEATARALLARNPTPLAARRVGRDLRQALERHEAGATTLVRDRNGELVGTLDASGRFALADGIEPWLVPPISAALIERFERLPSRPAEAQGAGLRLTLDLGLARLAVATLGPRRGTIVLVEPRTGSLLAAVSDPRTAVEEPGAAFTQRREPASIAKLLTAAAAYRAGIDADARIAGMTCAGVARYGGKPLWCAFPAGRLSGLDQALAVSCNVAFANLAMDVGREALVAEYRHWGFDAGKEALFGAAGHVRGQPRNDAELAHLAVGLDMTDVTPLHAALLAAAIGNDGTMPEPRLVTGGCGALGLTDRPQPLAPGRAVLAPSVAARLRRAMETVAERGSGAGLAPPGFPVALKTGTASGPRVGYHVNYIGIAPTPDAAVAFAVRVTHEPTSPAVTRSAREVTARLLDGLAARRVALARAARRQRPAPGAGGDVAEGSLRR